MEFVNFEKTVQVFFIIIECCTQLVQYKSMVQLKSDYFITYLVFIAI